MRKLKNLPLACLFALLGGGLAAAAAPAEWNQVRQHPVQIGPEADRLVVGFKVSAANSVIKSLKLRSSRTVQIRQAQTSAEDAVGLAQRAGIVIAKTRQLTPSMHVMFLPKTLYGMNVAQTLARLRADPAVAFVEVDERRYVHALTTPNDPLFIPTASASGQWFMLTPSTATPASDASATDAVSAWNITQGSSGTIIADVDSGFRFDHPDLGRAGFNGGRLLPGYDFVGQDYSATSEALGTFLTANDGDGWDPDPSDPGDWIDATDQANALFPAKRCLLENSSWHGTRVAGVLGAITNNDAGVAGMTWNPYILPVRALGKCGGYDSDIMTAMQWAAGLSITGVPDNPYPADIINLSLGGTGSCTSDYQTVIDTLTSMGVLIVASAGNESGPVDTPGNCRGVLSVAGLRNVGTKVGYSSFGPEVGISAPAGNCVNGAGLPCLRSIDTTFNEGATTPTTNSYTDQSKVNLGTSFSAPIVSGVAALMRAVNNNLTPPQLIARIQSSASVFTAPVGTPVCPNLSSTSECACTTTQCGAGMINAFSAVKAALNPIAAVAIPAGLTAGAATFDASHSVAACNQTIAGFAWTASGGVSISGAANAAQVTINWSGGAGILTLTVTDSAHNTDTAAVNFSSGGGARSAAPSSAGSAAAACPTPLNFTVAPPVITLAFSPASVSVNNDSTLTITLASTNPFALTQSGLAQALPTGLTIDSATAPSTSCTGANLTLTNTSGAATLANANIPTSGSCTVTMSVKSTAAGSYTVNDAASALTTGPAGSNLAAASATLTVTAPPPAKGGGGDLDVFDIMLITGVVLVARGKLRRRL